MSDRFDGSVAKLLDHCDTHQCSPFQLKQDSLRHSTTGFVHCVMIRQTTTNRLTQFVSKKYQFSCQCPPKEGVEPVTKLIFVGTKELGHSYTIRSIGSDNPKSNGVKIGSLARVQMNMYSITYVLKNLEGASIAYFVYHVPSPIKVMRDTPPRFAEIALFQPLALGNDDDHHDGHLLPIMKKHKKASTYFDNVCTDSISKYHNLGGINPEDPTIRVFRSLQPYISPATGRATLNFHGRGRYASPKNMQMIASYPNPASAAAKRNPSSNDSTQSSTIHMQMCKWDNDTYHIDFDTSMTFLNAFAFGLAQMDL
jgi:hypothetical protein